MHDILPKELIEKIYEYDDTYTNKYNEIIKVLKEFPKLDFYTSIDNNLYKCHFIKKYYIKDLNITDTFYCIEKYKKAYIIVAKSFSKPGTFIN